MHVIAPVVLRCWLMDSVILRRTLQSSLTATEEPFLQVTAAKLYCAILGEFDDEVRFCYV